MVAIFALYFGKRINERSGHVFEVMALSTFHSTVATRVRENNSEQSLISNYPLYGEKGNFNHR